MRLRSNNVSSGGQNNTSTPLQPQTSVAVPSTYHSAYRGIVPGPDGQFDHFLRTPDQTHFYAGYWRFGSYEDDRRAHARGFMTPEAVLVEQDRGDESYNGISLRWVWGANNPMIMPLTGSAAQHLQTIYEIRQLLGMSTSLRGQVPLYPVSQDVRVRQYWERKAQHQSTSCRPQPHPEAISNDLPLTVRGNDTILARSPSTVSASTVYNLDNMKTADRTLDAAASRPGERKHPTYTSDVDSAQASSRSVKDRANTGRSNAEQLPHQASETYPGLPCMDCGKDEGHKWDCHIGNLEPMKNITILDYRNLSDAVQRFDPGPWTTHFNPAPAPEPEDPETQMKGMAEFIRNEDSYKNDPDLHALPDDIMILLWAFKTSPGVDLIKE
ncbi:uncharacterized protein K460DRAFT_423380 [Cucurbitaria berberidis CBS 394.84]|uniref:Uncharacterized protein n=1 Tax=Cucurbitaria berberidis CBS 394.84 TaxID=1168544 RepID=A0A9P4GS64_9PLEO|nr:uncharacterized protein K460DRAFT_423380 [Cucurbitaria berberidis CBS 394.84]KAF1850832.1 hypothetical protein K460DRAFT_423380 [Cucurbitaria berberidis CBS 394.84]